MKKYVSCIFALLIVLGSMPLGVLADETKLLYATEPVYMRTGPNTKYSIILELQTGDGVEYIKRAGKWSMVRYGEIEGYVFSKYLSSTRPLAAGDIITAKGSVTVRKAASTASKKLGKLKKGDSVTFVASHGKWYEIKWNDSTAFVYKSYFKRQSSADKAAQYVGAVNDFFADNYKSSLLGIYLDNSSGKLCIRVSKTANVQRISAALKATGKVDMAYISILTSRLPFYSNRENIAETVSDIFGEYNNLPEEVRSKIRLSSACYDPQTDAICIELIAMDDTAQSLFKQYVFNADYLSFSSAKTYSVPMT